MVVLDEVSDNFLSVDVEVLREGSDVHGIFSIELNLSHDDGVFDVHDLLLDVLGVLNDSTLDFLEFVNSLLAVNDVLRNR